MPWTGDTVPHRMGYLPTQVTRTSKCSYCALPCLGPIAKQGGGIVTFFCTHVYGPAGFHPAHICGLDPPRPHLRRDSTHPAHISTGTGLTPPTPVTSEAGTDIQARARILGTVWQASHRPHL